MCLDLLVFNKPYGVTFSRSGSSQENIEEAQDDCEDAVFKKVVKTKPKTYNSNPYRTSGVVKENLNLVDCLPYLKKHFGFKKLHIARVPEM